MRAKGLRRQLNDILRDPVRVRRLERYFRQALNPEHHPGAWEVWGRCDGEGRLSVVNVTFRRMVEERA